MSSSETRAAWKKYREEELTTITPLLNELGFALEDAQPHVGGERYLMRAVTTASGAKLVLLARRKRDGMRVVVKATRDPGGRRELEHERASRKVLHAIRFAYRVFLSPAEVLFTRRLGYTISIQAFIEQESPFLARPLKEQFSLALKAFKAQEGAHATTYGHERLVRKTFSTMDAAAYLVAFERFSWKTLSLVPEPSLKAVFGAAKEFLNAHGDVVEQYCGFLTHTDFVPHNIRVKDGDIYLLDHSSLRFGNKYEGWARFINFMMLYNPPLAEALIDYVRLNRTPEESLSLKLMRVYRLGEIMCYYATTLARSEGDLLTLNTARIHFWARALESVLRDQPLLPAVLDSYRRMRDALRSEEEKLRQRDLH